jgi:hypothetical protein
MTQLQIGDQTVRYDRAATAAIYANLERGFAEECGCLFCQNFAAQRNLVYPVSFLTLLEQLGIDPNKEGEAFELGPLQDGFHLYGGWFYFVGEMVTWGEQSTNAGDTFEFWFTSVGTGPHAFRAGPRLTLEFSAHVRWTLPESPESARRPPSQR